MEGVKDRTLEGWRDGGTKGWINGGTEGKKGGGKKDGDYIGDNIFLYFWLRRGRRILI